MPEREYNKILAVNDRLQIKLVTSRGEIIYFVIQYYGEIKGKWRTIIRVDNSHGRAHKHVYHLHSKEFKIQLDQNNSAAFNYYKKYIEKNFSKIKENFLNS